MWRRWSVGCWVVRSCLRSWYIEAPPDQCDNGNGNGHRVLGFLKTVGWHPSVSAMFVFQSSSSMAVSASTVSSPRNRVSHFPGLSPHCAEITFLMRVSDCLGITMGARTGLNRLDGAVVRFVDTWSRCNAKQRPMLWQDTQQLDLLLKRRLSKRLFLFRRHSKRQSSVVMSSTANPIDYLRALYVVRAVVCP